MSKFAVTTLVLFLAVCVVEARECHYKLSGGTCLKQCCGKQDDVMYCLNSCENVSCFSHADCGRGCCENGKCGPPTSAQCDYTNTIIAVVCALGLSAIVVVIFVLIRYCRYRKPAPGMVILMNE